MSYSLANGAYFLRSGAYSTAPVRQVIDSFEDGSLSEYGGDTGNFSVVNNASGAYAGDHYCRGSVGLIHSTSGLDNYFGRGDTARAHTYCENSVTERAWVGFGFEDVFDYYAARVDYVNGAFALVRRTEANGFETLVEDTTVAPAADTWHAVDIDWQADDDIVLTLTETDTDAELASVSWTDSTHASETGIAFRIDGNGSNDVRFDEYILP